MPQFSSQINESEHDQKDLDNTRQESLANLLRHVFEMFSSDLIAALKESGSGKLKTNHFRLLLNLDLDGIRISHLAGRSRLTRPTVGALVHEMAELGIVVLEQDPSDGRAKLVVPTARGARLIFETAVVERRITQRYSKLIGKSRMSQLHSTLKLLLENLEG